MESGSEVILFKSGLRPPTRDQTLPFNIMAFDAVIAVTAGFFCSAVQWSDDKVKAKSVFCFVFL